jgi:hypothetical protein
VSKQTFEWTETAKEEIKQTNSPDKQAGMDYPYMCLKRHCLRQEHQFSAGLFYGLYDEV